MKKLIMAIVCLMTMVLSVNAQEYTTENIPVKIKSVRKTTNSASGVSVTVTWKNNSNKTVKYFKWSGFPRNAVGDMVRCSIRDYSYFTGSQTGPIKPGKKTSPYWDCVWYCWDVKEVCITKIEVEYMDGTSVILEGYDNIYKMFN